MTLAGSIRTFVQRNAHTLTGGLLKRIQPPLVRHAPLGDLQHEAVPDVVQPRLPAPAVLQPAAAENLRAGR